MKWVFYGVWQAIVIILISFIPFEQQGGSMWLEGNFVYFGIVAVVNINVLTATSNHTWISLLFQIGSIALVLIASVLLNFLKFSVLFGIIEPMFTSLEFYYILLLMLLAIVLVDIGLNYVNKRIRERMIKIARGIKLRIQNFRARKSTDSEPGKKRTKRSLHRGFAFDQEPGNAPQVVSRVRNKSVTRRSVAPTSNYSFLVESKGEDDRYLNKTMYSKASPKNRESSAVPIIQEETESENQGSMD